MWFDIIKDAGPLACLRATHQLVSRQWLRDQDAASWPADWEVDWVTYLPSATPPRVEVLQLARRADAAGANPALEATVAVSSSPPSPFLRS